MASHSKHAPYLMTSRWYAIALGSWLVAQLSSCQGGILAAQDRLPAVPDSAPNVTKSEPTATDKLAATSDPPQQPLPNKLWPEQRITPPPLAKAHDHLPHLARATSGILWQVVDNTEQLGAESTPTWHDWIALLRQRCQDRHGYFSPFWLTCRCPARTINQDPQGCLAVQGIASLQAILAKLALLPAELRSHGLKRMPLGAGILHLNSQLLPPKEQSHWFSANVQQLETLLPAITLPSGTPLLYPYWSNDPYFWLARAHLETSFLLQDFTTLVPWTAPSKQHKLPQLKHCQTALAPYGAHLPEQGAQLCSAQQSCWRSKQPDTATDSDCTWSVGHTYLERAAEQERRRWQQPAQLDKLGLDHVQLWYIGFERAGLLTQRLFATLQEDLLLLTWLSPDNRIWATCLLQHSEQMAERFVPPALVQQPLACWQGDFRNPLPPDAMIEPFLASHE